MSAREKYYEYWGLTKPPFDNVPDPEMYFDMHSSVNSAVAETLFAIEEGNECLAVLVGDVGLGKTTALRVILDSLDETRYRIAFLTNPDLTFMMLMREIIGQLTGEQCMECRRDAILETFNHLLFESRKAGRKVLIFIDEANAMQPANLESMRLLTNMQRDDENLMTIVLAGQLEFEQRLQETKHANLFQRIGVYCRITKIESPALMRDYIDHRLERAGLTEKIFSADAYDAVWEHSEQGIPRLVNKVAKLSLKAAQTQTVRQIDAHIVNAVGSRFSRMSTAIEKERWAPPVEAATKTAAPNRIPAPKVVAATKFPAIDVTTPSATPHRSATVETPQHQTDDTEQRGAELLAELITFPAHIYAKAWTLAQDQRVRFAGQLAAQVLQKHPQLIEKLGMSNDPVPAWNALRNVVIRQMEQHQAGQSVIVG